ncbi:hypothetical protein TEK04_03695 [Klenkia sp. LSe6-5]|uniref:WYL domain-containing protein n=1 Tax=Klenkia sesuvii TaxID=3103137 RepID=A0ABU8DPU1_9ACTN
MSWSSTARRVRDGDRPMGQRVNALHSLVARHAAPLASSDTRTTLRTLVGATGRRWDEEQVMRALEHLEATRSVRIAQVHEVTTRRRAAKAAGRRRPTAADLVLLQPPVLTPAPDIDLGAVLRRVVDEVFGPDIARTSRPTARGTHRVELTSPDEHRHAGVEASTTGWFGVWVLDDLRVSTFVVEYDQVEAFQAEAVRQVVRVAEAYLAGCFTVRHRRTLIRRRVQPLVDIDVDGATWTLRRPVFSR